MAELDVEALKRLECLDEEDVSREDVEQFLEQISAIIAALDDRERLRAAAQAWLDEFAENWGCDPEENPEPPKAAALRAALEGRDA